MVIYGRCENVSILYAKAIPGTQDPSKTFYSLGLWFKAASETGEIRCNEDVYNSVASFAGDLSKVVSFETSYNTQWKSFTLSKVVAPEGKK